MKTVFSTLTITILFLLSSLSEGIAFEQETDSFSRRTEESESELCGSQAEARIGVCYGADDIVENQLRVRRIEAVRSGVGVVDPGTSQLYEFKVEVENEGNDGKVMIILSGRDRNGREICTVVLKDLFYARELKTLTTTASLTSLNSRVIESWDVYRAHKFDDSRLG